ncbi:uncharacterized protein LOC124542307 [Vanessa cardui]|uniref:uncharacterized protein LOC124542307 n=1 Tax=Vanessa cardui TaxID=171605 RepID=UPI001F12AA49|nr:uncharacterized protein LOC124542307 [Vanessa cardui]
MKLRIVCLTIIINIENSFEKMNPNNFDMFLDYDSNVDTEKIDLRQRFLNRKKQIHDQDMKIKLFDKINSNKTLFVDGIMHSLEANGFDLKNEMEGAFRNILTMNGSKFIYKRDFFWRTWRMIENNSGNVSIICYKCESFVNETCPKCRSGGYWVIEEKPPKCSYEILSLKTNWELCIVNNAQYYNPFDVCPSVITVRDLRISCGDFIETVWRITKTYNVPERSTTVICQGRENCEVSTLYSIHNDSIVFRIIDSTNNVFYSRAMKSDNKNFVCYDDCGIFNPVTKEIKKREGPFVYDLLQNNKNKRDDKYVNPKKEYKKKSTPLNFKGVTKSVHLLNNVLHYKDQRQNEDGNLQANLSHIAEANKESLKSPCMKLQEKYLNDYVDDSDYYDY